VGSQKGDTYDLSKTYFAPNGRTKKGGEKISKISINALGDLKNLLDSSDTIGFTFEEIRSDEALEDLITTKAFEAPMGILDFEEFKISDPIDNITK
jgi:hypothetical protein